MSYWRRHYNTHRAQHWNWTTTPKFYRMLIKKMEEHMGIVSAEYNRWENVGYEMQRLSEEISTLIHGGKQLRVKDRETTQLPTTNGSTIQFVQPNLGRFKEDILMKMEDIKQLLKLTLHKARLNAKLRRVQNSPYEKGKISNKISEISCNISTLRCICGFRAEHYQPLPGPSQGPSPKYIKSFDRSRTYYKQVPTQKHPMGKSTKGSVRSKRKFNKNNRKGYCPSWPRPSHNINTKWPPPTYMAKKKIWSNMSKGGLVNENGYSSFNPPNRLAPNTTSSFKSPNSLPINSSILNVMTNHHDASTSTTFVSHLPNQMDIVDEMQYVQPLRSVLPEHKPGRDDSRKKGNTEDSILLNLQNVETKNDLQNSHLDSSNQPSSSSQSQRLKPACHCSRDQTNGDPPLMMIDDYPEFNDQQKELIEKATSSTRDPHTVLISKFNLSITREEICELLPCTWLTDAVINFYMNLLRERSELRSNDGYPKVYAMNTFFAQRLCSGGYSAVERWTKHIDIFAFDIIPIPIHSATHWSMVIINMKEKTIKYYDSMEGQPFPSNLMSALEKYLKKESLDKRKIELDFRDWKIVNVTDSPRQQNEYDCGVFTCMIAEFVCRNRPILFSQQHMNYFREKMVLEIYTGKMLL